MPLHGQDGNKPSPQGRQYNCTCELSQHNKRRLQDWQSKVKMFTFLLWGEQNMFFAHQLLLSACKEDRFGSFCSQKCNCQNPNDGCHHVTSVTSDCNCMEDNYPDYKDGTCRNVCKIYNVKFWLYMKSINTYLPHFPRFVASNQ